MAMFKRSTAKAPTKAKAPAKPRTTKTPSKPAAQVEPEKITQRPPVARRLPSHVDDEW